MSGQSILCCTLALFASFGVAEESLFPFAALTRMFQETQSETRDSSGREEVREEFDQTYPAGAGRVQLENINGRVSIGVWDRNEVRVRATKRARTRERLDEARIVVLAETDGVRIKTEYPPGESRDAASVEYSLTVPRGARLDRIALINGDLQIENVAGAVHASTINGALTARGIVGDARLSTVNGRIEATLDSLRENGEAALDSVNGAVTLTLPSDANATVRARVLQGAISNDFNIPVRRGRYFGTSLAARLGAGAARVNLNSVHGAITLRRAADNRQPAPVTNLLSEASEEDEAEREVSRTVERETARAAREAARVQRQTTQIEREAARAVSRVTARAVERAVSEAMRDVERSMEDLRDSMPRGRGREGRIIEREQRNFTVTGTPRVRAETFDGSITVRVWDRGEVGVTVAKRGQTQDEVRRVQVRMEQRGDEISLVTELAEARSAGNSSGVTNDNAGADVIVNVPRQANVNATTSDGNISIEGIEGEMVLRTSDGSIGVRRARGRVQAVTADGSIRISGFEGATDARTSDGSISLDGNFNSLAARTEDGAIMLTLPANMNATIETRAESVIHNGLATAEDTNEEARVRRWRVGSGGSLFTLRAADGYVVFRRPNLANAGGNSQNRLR